MLALASGNSRGGIPYHLIVNGAAMFAVKVRSTASQKNFRFVLPALFRQDGLLEAVILTLLSLEADVRQVSRQGPATDLFGQERSRKQMRGAADVTWWGWNNGQNMEISGSTLPRDQPHLQMLPVRDTLFQLLVSSHSRGHGLGMRNGFSNP